MSPPPNELAERLPSPIKFGTSSWTYEGWHGLVYTQAYASAKQFTQQSLSEYAQFPWFRTVGVDSSFYAPPTPRTLAQYASSVPTGFRWVAKVWERITIPEFPSLPRYGKDAGKHNPEFLNAESFSRQVLGPLSDPLIGPHVGPLVFQFPTIAPRILTHEQFIHRLDSFLAQLPSTFLYAVEIRNSEFLTADYFSVLNNHRATHCFNHWHRMPPLHEQMKAAARAGGITAPFFVARILTPLGVSYEAAVKLFQPYREIRRPNPEMRRDVVRLARRGLERNIDTYIIVNNRSEGCAPLTIAAIGEMIVSEL